MPVKDAPWPAAGPLVGRAAELEVLDEAIGRVRRMRSAGCVAVAGGLGLGKTRLLGELGARAAAAGDLVFTGRGSELEHGAPYGTLVEALDDYLAAGAPGHLAGLGEDVVRELRRIFPAVAGEPAGGRPVEAERFRAHRAVRALLEELARRRPVVLAFDDLHWADPETAELVAHLLRRPPAAPVLLAVAYRPPQLAAPVRAAIERAPRDGPCVVIELRPLTDAEAAALLGDAVPEQARAVIVRESAGNPFFLEQLARAAAGGSADQGTLRLDAVPPAVIAALESELATLDAGPRRLLAGAAVAGEPFELELAAVAAALDEDAALPALDALVAADLVRPTQAPRRFVFRHPLVRRAVHAAAGPGWTLVAHRRLADALRARDAPVTAIARHVEHSAAHGEEAAIATLVQAGDATLPRAPATAAHWFAATLDLLPHGDERRLGLLVSRATALGGAGRLAEACDVLHEVLAALPPDAHELRARAVTSLARMQHPLGRHGQARALLEGTLAQLPERRSRAAALITLELVSDHLLSTEFEAMASRADQALEIARALADPLLHAASWAGIAHARMWHGRIAEALEAAADAASILDGLEDDACVPLLETFWWLAVVEDALERWQQFDRHLERGLRLGREFGAGFVVVALMHAAPVAHGWRGRHAEARRAAAAAVEAAHLSGSDSSLAYAYTAQCFAHTQAGEGDVAVAAGERAVDLARPMSAGLFVALPHVNLGAALLETGRFERARAQLVEGRDRGALEHYVGRCWWELWMARAELGLGATAAADEWVGRAATTAGAMGLAGRQAAVRHASAAVLLARGAPASAADEALLASEQLAATGLISDSGRARMLAGRALAAAGDGTRAVRELQQARAVLIECDAPRLADLAAGELRRLGLRVPRPGPRASGESGLDALSAREHEIAELVATGRTNRQIAHELHLAESTVENHLSRTFAKLDISSRAALAQAVGRERAP